MAGWRQGSSNPWGFFFLQSVFYFLRSYLLAFVGERVMADLRIKLFSHLQRLSLSFFNERRTGELVSRLTNDVSTVRPLPFWTLVSAPEAVRGPGGWAFCNESKQL